jgi:hypothetical protein
MADLIHPHRIQGIAQGVNGLAKVDLQFRRCLFASASSTNISIPGS